MIYLELLIVSAVVVFIVDLSGFTQVWLGWLNRWLNRHALRSVHQLRPFSCSLCMVWWCCLLWSLIRGRLSVYTVGASAAFAFFSNTFCEVLIFMKDWATWLVNKLQPKWTDRD